MSCEQYDWKAYALGELTLQERREAEAHAPGCQSCREELAHVRLTVDTLAALREEEPPRRIAFVSDKVFEPRWWQVFLRPSFAAALVIAAAILMHGYLTRTSEADIQARVNDAVSKAVADVEQRNVAAINAVDGKLTSWYAQATGVVRQ